MRYCLLFEYDGEKYHGWQVQPDAVTVQQTITKCLCDILNQSISLIGAGRTDTGVHAKFMTAHFDCNFEIEAKDIKQKLNNYLPAEISILKVINVKNNFHARFDAISRTYKYYINQQKMPFEQRSFFYKKEIDIALMNKACKNIIGKKDFTSFSKANTQTHTNICEIYRAKWTYEKQMICFTIQANRFLRNMVRAIVGTMLLVGEKKISPDEISNIIKKKNRSFAGVSVPAKGLFLVNIKYNEKDLLA